MDPITAMLVMQTVMSIKNGFDGAKASKQAAEENRNNAVTAMTDEVTGLNEQVRQSEDIAFAKEHAERLRVVQAKSTATAAGRNVAGAGVDRIFADAERMLSDSLNNSKANREGNRRTLKAQKKPAFSRSLSRINSTPAVGFDPASALVQGGLAIATNKVGADRHAAALKGGAP